MVTPCKVLLSLYFSQLNVFTVDQLKPPGDYGVRGAAPESSSQRQALRDSLLQFPLEVFLISYLIFFSPGPAL